MVLALHFKLEKTNSELQLIRSMPATSSLDIHIIQAVSDSEKPVLFSDLADLKAAKSEKKKTFQLQRKLGLIFTVP